MVVAMNKEFRSVERVRIGDLWQVTALVFANMTGVDQQFTAMTDHWLGWLWSWIYLPFYLLTAGRGFKICQGRRLAGFAYLHLRPQSGYIFNVVVDHPFRRQGVGRTLMHYLEQEISRAGRHWAVLQVDGGNIPAQRLYTDLGYQAYHPFFWQWSGGRWPHQLVDASARLERPWGRGRALYHYFATLERETGDAPVAAIIDAEYPIPRPVAGEEWRCVWQGQDVGYGWGSASDAGTVLVLLLQPTLWGDVEVLRSFVQMLLDEVGGRRGVIDLHLGSGGHHDAAANTLQSLGFTPRSQPRILMVKELG